MVIKHFAGYGKVEVNKVSKTIKDGIVRLRLHVEGSHEWGLVREDKYDVLHWLLSHYDKSITDERDIIALDVYPYSLDGEVDVHGNPLDACDYTIYYNKKK